MRVGHGFDVHGFTEGQFVVLGGVRIPHHQAFKAHSDGDVLIHALIDALLGAAGLGDIGQWFPDHDPAYAGIDSRQLLRQVVEKLGKTGWQLHNADITIVAQAPKIGPHITQMKALLATDLQVEPTALNIKATTTERLGYIGREEGIACHAVCLLDAC